MAITGSSYRSRLSAVKADSGWSRHASHCFATTDDHRSEMILRPRSPHMLPGLVNEALSIRRAHPLCNIAVLAAVIGNPRIDGMAAASKGCIMICSTTGRSAT
jgi:hypothetical protein